MVQDGNFQLIVNGIVIQDIIRLETLVLKMVVLLVMMNLNLIIHQIQHL